MKGFEIKFNIYANNKEEVEQARKAIVDFIDTQAKCGRAVSATRIAEAVSKWDKNPFVRNEIIKYFS